jgi:hypothetical protein
MSYRFKCKVWGDVWMLQRHGDWLLQLIGKPPAPKGIIEPPAMASALAALRRAADEDDQIRASGVRRPTTPADDVSDPDPVGVRQRVWPMVEMLQAAEQAQVPVVWGV